MPEQVLTDNGKVFTGKYSHPPVEVLFDRICRLNGVQHLLTQPRTPTTTGKIERFHRTLRVEFDTRQVFRNLTMAQAALDEWVAFYNTARTHQSLGDTTPASRFRPTARTLVPERNGEQWVSRSVSRNGVVFVALTPALATVSRTRSQLPGPHRLPSGCSASTLRATTGPGLTAVVCARLLSSDLPQPPIRPVSV